MAIESMEMEEYKSNSNKLKEEKKAELPERKVKQAVTKNAKRKKKGELQKIKDVLVSEDIRNVKSYIFSEVIIPSVKKTVIDTVTNGLNLIFYGSMEKTGKSPSATKVSFGKHYSSVPPSSRTEYSSFKRSSYSDTYAFDDILFESRGDAESVLDAMNEIISTYGVVSVADMYDLCDIPTDNFTANKYGWTDISGCRASRCTDGYVLKLPRAIPID